jgi:hypothetical protein
MGGMFTTQFFKLSIVLVHNAASDKLPIRISAPLPGILSTTGGGNGKTSFFGALMLTEDGREDCSNEKVLFCDS